MAVKITMKVPKILILQPGQVVPVFLGALDNYFIRALSIMSAAARAVTPIGATGNLNRNIKGESVQKGFHQWWLQITWQAPYAAAAENGSRPHWAPLTPLRLWVAAKGWEPRAAIRLQQHIARKGTRGARFVSRTRARSIGPVTTAWNQFGNYFAGLLMK